MKPLLLRPCYDANGETVNALQAVKSIINVRIESGIKLENVICYITEQNIKNVKNKTKKKGLIFTNFTVELFGFSCQHPADGTKSLL